MMNCALCAVRILLSEKQVQHLADILHKEFFVVVAIFRSPGHPAVWSQQGRGLGTHKQGTSNILSSIFVDPDP